MASTKITQDQVLEATRDARTENLQLVKDFLKEHSVNDLIWTRYPNQDSLLHMACIHNNLPLVEHLLEVGADVNILNCRQETPLMFACSADDWIIYQLLIKRGAQVQVKDALGETALFHTIQLDILGSLLDLGLDPLAKNNEGQTILDLLDAEDPEESVARDFLLSYINGQQLN